MYNKDFSLPHHTMFSCLTVVKNHGSWYKELLAVS